MNEDLSRLVASLLAQAKGGEDLSSGISRVRTIIKKVIEGENTILGKFQALVKSFREVIPEEKQRYQAAIRALSTTSKLSREEIVTAVNNQLEELKILEKLLISALPHAPREFKAMEARSQKVRNEISGLREKIAQLEKEEKEIADSMAGPEKKTSVIEKALREVFTDIAAEITSVKKQVQELHVESAVQQWSPDTEIKTDFAGKKQSNGQKSTGQISPHNAAKPQKTCPLCGRHMSFSTTRNMWQCFSCAYEELEKDEVQSKNRERSEDTISPEPAPDSEPKKKCRVCGGRMDYYISEKKWQCFSCAYEESEKDGVQGKNGELSEDIVFPEPVPAAELEQSGEKGEQGTTPEPTRASELKQKCPMCGGQMDYYIADRKWQCYSCGFENNEYNKDTDKTHPHPVLPLEREGVADKDKSNALLAISAAESLFDPSSTAKPSSGYWEPKKVSSSKKLPAITKTCPACNKKMHWYGSDRGWQCRHCGYERRI